MTYSSRSTNTRPKARPILERAVNITEMIDSAGTHNYSYDNLDRLTAATHPNQPNESYSYDDVGNRTASHQGSSYSYQQFNRLVSANGTSFGYDTNGNQTSKSDSNGAWAYSWDYENRLKQASLSGGVSVTYSYDALGRRVQRTSTASGIEKFIYDGADVVRDLDTTNATIAEYLNGPGIDNKLRQTSSGNSSFFLADHLGTTRTLADSAGGVTSNLQFDSFGNLMGGASPTHYTYTGREIDSESALMYYRARWFAPNQGRFITEDPVGFEGNKVNLYSYISNDPVNDVDPMGLSPSFLKCLARCSADQFGITTILGATGVVSGLPLLKKPFVTPGSSPRTSIASKALSSLFPHKLSRRVLAPTLVRPLARSIILGRVIGRWIPIVGWGLLAYDAVSIGICVNDCMKEGGCRQ